MFWFLVYIFFTFWIFLDQFLKLQEMDQGEKGTQNRLIDSVPVTHNSKTYYVP